MAQNRASEAVMRSVRELLPRIAEAANSIENARAVPREIIKDLAAAGVFRMLAPRCYGGEELSLLEGAAIIEELAGADGSVAWNVMIGAGVGALCARYPDAEEIFAHSPDCMARGALAPKGLARPVKGGYMLDGRWPLASGSFPAGWVLAGCFVVGDEETDSGAGRDFPKAVLAVLPVGEVRFIETWDGLGLRASESNDFVVEGRFVSHDRCIPMDATSEAGPALWRLPPIIGLMPGHCGLVLGLTRAILIEILALANVKRPLLNATIRMAQDPLVQHRLGMLDMRLGAISSFSTQEITRLWRLAETRDVISPADRVRFRSAVAWIHGECRSIANEAFAMSGSAGIYATSSLQRRWRDLNVACQHIIAATEIHQYHGALLLGEAPAITAVL